MFDHIMMLCPKASDGKDGPESLSRSCIHYPDELECFEKFKELTGGIIHQEIEVEATPYNDEFLEGKVPGFKVIKHEASIPDRRFKEGKRVGKWKTYEVYDREYSDLNSLNRKERLFMNREIRFDDLLDIIPYYPYGIIYEYTDANHEQLTIASRNYLDIARMDGIKFGHDSSGEWRYLRQLQEHYLEVVALYFTDRIDSVRRRNPNGT